MSVSEAIAAAGQLEKLGIVGILAILCALEAYAVYYFRRELMRIHLQLERAKQALLIVRIAADSAGATYDLSRIKGLDDVLG